MAMGEEIDGKLWDYGRKEIPCMDIKQMVEQGTILKIISGSHLYGTNTENSDKDYMGICIPTKDYIVGMHKFEQLEERTNPSNSDKQNNKADNDYTCYSLPKFIKLAYDNNPNILEMLFVPEESIIYCDVLGRQFLEHRKLFVSKRAYYKFMGYATAQKRKLITKHPEGLRVEIVKKHGYDTKYASHLIRLLYFGIEILRTGELVFPTEHKKYLIQIKNGEWPLSQIIDKATYLENYLEESLKISVLPEYPNLEEINQLQINLIERFWSN